MRTALCAAAVVLIALGCKPAPAGHLARGTLVLDPELAFGAPDQGLGADRVAAVLATEAEVVTSARRIVEKLGLDREPPFGKDALEAVRRALTAGRRGNSLILEVSATNADPQLAQVLCNTAMQVYIETRLMNRMGIHEGRAQVLADQLDDLSARFDGGEVVEMTRKALREEELAGQLRDSDVRVLDTCELVRR